MSKYISIAIIALITLNCKNPIKNNFLFSKKEPSITGVSFKNIIKDDAKFNIVNYLYYYNGGGIAVGDINNDSLPDLYFVSNRGENELYLNKGNLQFENITQSSGTKGSSNWNTGATMVDINNDGLLDIYVCAVTGLLDFKGHNELFINNGDNTFTERSSEYGLDYKGYSTQAYFFDYDKDGDLDTYIVNHAVHTKNSHGPAQIREKRLGLVGDVLLKNDNNKFNDFSEEAKIYGGENGYGLSASIADFNNDGWDDIYVCNDFHEDDYYYINNQDGTFKESLVNSFSQTSRFSMGSDAADINADGYQDIITLDMLPYDEKTLKESDGDVSYNIQDFLLKQGYHKQYARNMLQLNNKGENFTEVGLYNNIAATDWSWAPLIADFNQDGHQDIFISNGIHKRPNNLDFMKYISNSFKNKSNRTNNNWLLNSLKEMPEGKVSNQIFKGNSKRFVNKTGQWIDNTPSLSNGAIYTDLDLDGDLDIVTNNLNDFANIYENSTNKSKNYLKIKLDYIKNNRDAIGSKAILYSNGQKQIKQLFLSRGFLSSLEPKIHFGLGSNKSVDSLLIIWPNNTYQKVENISINNEIKITYNNNNLTYSHTKISSEPKLFNKVDLIDFLHAEDTYNDFDNEKLIPYKVSISGPAIAVGDVNNDGFEDIYIGNSSRKKSKLFISNGEKFSLSNGIKEIENDSLYEDTDAVFLDIDNDKDLDLYVATGINYDAKHQSDRLYINNGDGIFTKKKHSIPNNKLNSSSVKAYDYDNDGDEDLFIGNRSKKGDFGLNVPSYLLNNNGSGEFTIDKNFKLVSKITDASWQDINNDGIKDLIVATEWDKPRIYINKNGILKEKLIRNKINGLWQSIIAFDIDFDGDKDIMLGNWGLNSKFQPTKDSPLLMYYSDFDNNGKKETVLAYKIDINYYPVNSKDELSSQMNIINKRFSNYTDFAYKPIEEILTKKAIDQSKKYEVHTLASGYLKNNSGNFDEFVEFPQIFQLSPIMYFLKYPFIGKNDELLSVGNFQGLNTYHGILNSNNGFIMKKVDSIGRFEYYSTSNLGLNIKNKETRKILVVNLKKNKLLITAINNNSLQTHSFK